MNNGDYRAKVIVVEDEIIILRDIIQKLKSIGYEVPAGVSSGEEALEKVQEIKPDIVIMDIQIEGDMDGIEVANEIMNKYGIPVIYLTSYSDSKTFNRAIGTEPDNYLVKPFDETELKTAIETSLFQRKLKDE
jgi:CheY-like chemotaxis protein